MQKDSFRKWHEAVMTEHSLSSLPSYLIMPIQRIPRYQLLLTELLKNTEPSYEDYSECSHTILCCVFLLPERAHLFSHAKFTYPPIHQSS